MWESIVVVTGALDLVTDGQMCYVIRNGHPLMQVTGMGCQLTGLIGCYIAKQSSHQSRFSGVLNAVCLIGIAGEIAFQQLREGEEGKCQLWNSRHRCGFSHGRGDV